MKDTLLLLHLDRANVAFKYKDYALAIQDCSLALENFIDEEGFEFDRTAVYTLRARSYYELKDYDNAMKDAEEILAMSKMSYFGNRIRSMVCYQRKEYEKALGYFKEILELNLEPNLYRIHFAISRSLYYLDRYSEAINEYKKCLTLTDDKERIVNVYVNMAMVYLKWGLIDEAENVFKKSYETAINEHSCRAIAWFYYETRKNYNLALEYINKALICDPKSHNALDTRANIYCELNEFDKALDDINIAIKLCPDQPDPEYDYYETRAKIYERIGKSDLAQADLERANSID